MIVSIVLFVILFLVFGGLIMLLWKKIKKEREQMKAEITIEQLEEAQWDIIQGIKNAGNEVISEIKSVIDEADKKIEELKKIQKKQEIKNDVKIKNNLQNEPLDIQETEVLKLYRKGYTVMEIMEITGIYPGVSQTFINLNEGLNKREA